MNNVDDKTSSIVFEDIDRMASLYCRDLSKEDSNASKMDSSVDCVRQNLSDSLCCNKFKPNAHALFARRHTSSASAIEGIDRRTRLKATVMALLLSGASSAIWSTVTTCCARQKYQKINLRHAIICRVRMPAKNRFDKTVQERADLQDWKDVTLKISAETGQRLRILLVV